MTPILGMLTSKDNMFIERKYLVLTLLLLIIALPVILILCSIYKSVLNLFPIYSELEIQFYVVGVLMIFTIYGLFYWLSRTRLFISFIHDVKKINVNLMIVGAGLIQLIYLKFFLEKTYPTVVFSKALNDAGILPFGSFSWLFAWLIFFVIFSILLIIVTAKFRINTGWYYFLSISLIIFLSFGVASTNAYDYAYFAGPINDVLHGKFLLYNTPSQYGFLSIIALSLPFHFLKLSLFNLVLLNSVAVTFSFCLLFLLLQHIFRSKLFLLFLMSSIIFFNYNVQIQGRGDFPQTNFLRFGWWIIVALILAIKMVVAPKYRIVSEIVLLLSLGLSSFWIIDNGLYILLAYLSFVVFNSLERGLIGTIKFLIVSLLKIGGVIGLLFLLIEGIYRLFWIPINWNSYISDSQYYLSGFGLMSLPNEVGWHWVIIGTYLLTLLYLFVVKRFNKREELDNYHRLLSFILFYGIFQFIYFMGRSHLNNLHHVIIPFMICFGFLVERLLFKMREVSKVYKLIGISSVALMVLLPYYFIFIQGAINFRSDNFLTAIDRIKNSPSIEYKNTANLIGFETLGKLNQQYGNYIEKNGITLVSNQDTWYLIELNKVNNIPSNNLNYYVDNRDLTKIADGIEGRKDQYIFVSKRSSNPSNEVKVIMDQLMSKKYHFKENI